MGWVLMALPANVSGAEYPWELKKDEDGIKAYVRKVDGSSILEYKGTVRVNAGVEEAARFFEDDGRTPEWFYECTGSWVIETKSPVLDPNDPARLRRDSDDLVRSDEKIIYFSIHMPWPVKDRDAVFRRVRVIDPGTGAVKYETSALPDGYPEQKGKVRMPYMKGLWIFTPLAEGGTEISYQEHSEVGGHIPDWLVNRLAVNVPFESLARFRDILSGEKEK